MHLMVRYENYLVRICFSFFLFDSLRPRQQSVSYVGTGLPGLNQYLAGINMSC